MFSTEMITLTYIPDYIVQDRVAYYKRGRKRVENQPEWDQLSVLHNYSCPVARVMVCIDAAAVVRRTSDCCYTASGICRDSLCYTALQN